MCLNIVICRVLYKIQNIKAASMHVMTVLIYTAKRLKQEGIENDELALFIANTVLRGLGRKSFRDAIRIARKSKTIQDVEETIQTLKKYDVK
jgi:hypothetical protein